MTKPNTCLILGIIFVVLTWLFVGFFRDDEFYEPQLFTKYRPTFKVNFYSPVGMQDLDIDKLDPDSKAEEIAFQEFVINQHIQNNSNARLSYLPFILIQCMLTFFSFGILEKKSSIVYKWQLPIHFLVCFIFTLMWLGGLLRSDNLVYISLGGLIVFAINYGFTLLLTRKQRVHKRNEIV